MKKYLQIIFSFYLTALLSSCDNSKEKTIKTDIVEKFLIDLNHDNFLDTIFLLDKNTSGDPGTFKKIKITGKNIISFELEANESWDTIPKYLRKDNYPGIKSDLIYLKKFKNTSYILLTGYEYSVGQEDFALIGIEEKKCSLLTRENFNDVAGFKDLNNDGKIEILLNPTWAEAINYIDSLNATIQSYSPFYVYSLTPKSFVFDSDLTKSYNEKHYTWVE